MTSATRWLAPVALALGLGVGVLSPQAHAQNSLPRVLVDVADVVMRSGDPYYRYGNNGYGSRLIMQHDAYGRPVYYRTVNRNGGHHDVDHGAYGNGSYGNDGYGNGYYDNNGYGNGSYGNNSYGNGYYQYDGHGNGSYGNNGYRNNHDGNQGYYGNLPYGNAYGYYRNGTGRHVRSSSGRRHRKHERHDCQGHGQCGH